MLIYRCEFEAGAIPLDRLVAKAPPDRAAVVCRRPDRCIGCMSRLRIWQWERTGAYGVVALRRQAERVLGVDVDPWSRLQCTLGVSAYPNHLANAAFNQIRLGEWPKSGQSKT